MTEVAHPLEDTLEKLGDLIAPAERVAVCAYGPAVFAKPGVTRGQDLLVLCEGYSNGLRAHLRVYNGEEFRFLIADRILLESDLEKGTLGDYLTEQFLYPYQPIFNIEYLDKIGKKAKTRVAEEEAKDLVIEFLRNVSRDGGNAGVLWSFANEKTRSGIYPKHDRVSTSSRGTRSRAKPHGSQKFLQVSYRRDRG